MRLFPQTVRGKETTKYTKYTKRRYAQDCQRGKSPRKTRTTRKKTACGEGTTEHTEHTEKDCMWGEKPRNTRKRTAKRTASVGSRGWGRRGEVKGRGCALTNQRGRYAPRSPNTADAPFLQTSSGSFTQCVGQQVRLRRIPMSSAAGCDVTLHRLPPSSAHRSLITNPQRRQPRNP